MLASVFWICIVGLVVRISLSGLHSLVDKVKLWALIGGLMNL